MLKRSFRQYEVKNYQFIVGRSSNGGYSITDTDIEEKDRDMVNSYIDTLILDNDLIPDDADRVLVNLKETGETLTCEVKTFS